MDIISLIRIAKSQDASDIHLVVSSPPLMRQKGSLVPYKDSLPLDASDIQSAFEQLASMEARSEFERALELDFNYSLSGVGYLRCNAAMQRGSISLAIRLLPPTVPDLDDLGVPEICKDLALRKRGLVIITGPTGSGKSTTLAAMLEYLNQNESRHIVTIEDPIEYVFTNARCAIDQRQIGRDTFSFADALRRVLRQDPDVIMVGEMRDLETASAVLTIAETGHLVLSTGHAPSAPQAMERIIDLFPIEERSLAQTRLASLLLAAMCQTLVVKADGSGRVPAFEIMLGTTAVKNLIRDGKFHQLPNVIRTSREDGMTSLDDALLRLYFNNSISAETAFEHCVDRDELSKAIGKRQAMSHPTEPRPVSKTKTAPTNGHVTDGALEHKSPPIVKRNT
jgi:twitching motility protein PilT